MALDDADLVVESLDKAERDLVLRSAVGSDTLPMAIDHLGELHVGWQALPLGAIAPVLEEAPRKALALIRPELAEGLLEQVGGTQALLGSEQGLERLPAVCAQVLLARQPGGLLTQNVTALLAGQPGIFALADLVERLTQVAHDRELIEQDGGLGRLLARDIPKRFPHVLPRPPKAFRLVVPEPMVKLAHTGLGAIFAAKPDRPTPDQVTDHDAVGMPLADRDLVNADRSGAGRAGPFKRGAPVRLLQRLDRAPVALQLPGPVLDGGCPHPPAPIKGEALYVQRVVGQKVQPFSLHPSAALAGDPPDLQFPIDAGIAARQAANPADLAVMPVSRADS